MSRQPKRDVVELAGRGREGLLLRRRWEMGKQKWDGWLRGKQGERKERRADFGVSCRIGFFLFLGEA